MKHVFIINPAAGKKNHVEQITNELKRYDGKIDYEIYVTQGVKDALCYTRNYLQNNSIDRVRFYSCGGDGTLNEVCNGIVGYDNAELACVAIGSGNDFVKYYGTVEDFLNIDNIINGDVKNIDLFKVGDCYCLNICNFGFDAWVCDKMAKFKRWPFVSGPVAYDLGVIYCLLFKMKHYIKLEIDDKLIFDGKALLCAVSNGICYGGGYYCTPEAKVDDNIADVCLIKQVSVFKAAGLIKTYKQGKHISDPNLKDIVVYEKGRKIKVSSNKPICYCVDGELMQTEQLEIDVLPNKMNFVVPKREQ